MWISGLVLRFYYYGILHVWRNTILSGKKLIRREMEKSKNETIDEEIQTKFFRYVFVTRSTWFCGTLKHIEMTVLILPEKIINCIRVRGQRIEYSFYGTTKKNIFGNLKEARNLHKIILSLLCPILVLLVNLVIILLAIIALVLTIPIIIAIFFYNLLSTNVGFKLYDIDAEVGSFDRY